MVDKFANIQNPRFVLTLESYNSPILNGLIHLYRNDHCRLMNKLVEVAVLQPDVVGKIWAQCLGYTYVNPLQSVSLPGSGPSLPLDICKQQSVVHLYTLNGVASICMVDPSNRRTIVILQRTLQQKVSASFGLPNYIREAIQRKCAPLKSHKGSSEEIVSQDEISAVFKAKRKRNTRIVFKECA